MTLQVLALPTIVILTTLEALMTVILTILENISVQVSLTNITYELHNIAIVKATDLTMKFLQT